MIPQLPPDLCKRMTDCYASHVKMEKGYGKKTYIIEIIKRPDFLPEDIQEGVDFYRGKMPQDEFILGQSGFMCDLGYIIFGGRRA